MDVTLLVSGVAVLLMCQDVGIVFSTTPVLFATYSALKGPVTPFTVGSGVATTSSSRSGIQEGLKTELIGVAPHMSFKKCLELVVAKGSVEASAVAIVLDRSPSNIELTCDGVNETPSSSQ